MTVYIVAVKVFRSIFLLTRSHSLTLSEWPLWLAAHLWTLASVPPHPYGPTPLGTDFEGKWAHLYIPLLWCPWGHLLQCIVGLAQIHNFRILIFLRCKNASHRVYIFPCLNRSHFTFFNKSIIFSFKFQNRFNSLTCVIIHSSVRVWISYIREWRLKVYE